MCVVILVIGLKLWETMTGEFDFTSTKRETKNCFDVVVMYWYVFGCLCYDVMYLRMFVDDFNDMMLL